MTRQGNVSILIKARDATQAAIASVSARLSRFAQGVGRILGGATRALGALGIGVSGVSALLLPFITRATMEFQKFSAQLRIFTGSSSGAARVMEDLKRLAMDLPFDLAQITEAFVTLRSGGIDPSEDTMRRLGDIASGMGKDILTLAQAVKNGTMGEMEMLKQFGFSMRVEGDQLRASFGKTTKLIGRDAGSILGFLEEIAQKDFSGAAAARMATLEGAFSNLQDKAWNLAVVIGEKGGVAEALAELANDAASLADAVERNEASVVKWTRVLVDLFQFLASAVVSGVVVPFNAATLAIAEALAFVLRFGQTVFTVLNGVARGIGRITGGNAITDGLEALTDPSMFGASADWLQQFSKDRAQGILDRGNATAQRLADLAVSMEGERIGGGGGVGSGGLAGRTRTPVGGIGGQGDTIDEMLRREQKIDAARAKREEEARERQREAFAEDRWMAGQINRGAGVDRLLGAGLPSTKELNEDLALTLAQLSDFEALGPTAMQSFEAAIANAAAELPTLGEQLRDVGLNGLFQFTEAFGMAFAQITEGWGAVGAAMQDALRNAVSYMAAQMSKYYAAEAAGALGKGFFNPAAWGAAAKFMAASAAFAALAGATRGGSLGGSGRAGGFGVGIGGPLDSVSGAPVTVVLPNSGVINVNDPRTQDEFVAMLEKLSGRAVEIRRR